MKNLLEYKLSKKQISILEVVLIVGFAIIPLFATYPFRINIFLSYEGAYRMYMGQMPFRDFSLPMGYGYWVIPFIFFKIFGPYLSTLVKAQVFINIIAGLGFRSIGLTLGLSKGVRFLGVALFTISYSFFNFWPWYNHTVIVFEIIAIAFILKAITIESTGYKPWLYSFLAGLFAFWSFFTKQDGGFFAVVIPGILCLYAAIVNRSWLLIARYVIAVLLVAALVIIPLLPYEFGYWFNYGQPPHYGRLSLFDIINEFFDKSQAIKFYLFIVVIILLIKLREPIAFFKAQKEFLFFILTLLVLGQAAVLQVTSYTPPDGNIYFHSFAVIFILASFSQELNFSKLKVVGVGTVLIFLWWSGIYWKYASRTIARVFPEEQQQNNKNAENVISIRTYKLDRDTLELNKSTWKLSGMKSFDKVYLPQETIDGINRLKALPVMSSARPPKIFNMSELTPLANELGYELEKGQPLWYHLGVGMFNRELEYFRSRIKDQYYDVVLFEIIPNLNNFYPNQLREELQKNYTRIDVFQAPRRNKREVIEVYVPVKKP